MSNVINEDEVVSIKYTNYRGITDYRRILPVRMWFGSTEWHKKDQWLLEATDLNKGEIRHFAMADILEWKN